MNLAYRPYTSFTNAQLPLLKVAALWFNKLVILDPVGASWDTVGEDYVARGAVRLLNSRDSKKTAQKNNLYYSLRDIDKETNE